MPRKRKKTPDKITQQDFIKIARKVRRDLEIELQIPKEFAKIWKTSKKDRIANRSNTIRDIEDEK